MGRIHNQTVEGHRSRSVVESQWDRVLTMANRCFNSLVPTKRQGGNSHQFWMGLSNTLMVGEAIPEILQSHRLDATSTRRRERMSVPLNQRGPSVGGANDGTKNGRPACMSRRLAAQLFVPSAASRRCPPLGLLDG